MEKVLQQPTSEVEVDFDDRAVFVRFIGEVTLEDYKSALLKAADMVRDHDVQNVLMNRLEIGKIPTEGRIWVKNVYLKKIIKPLVRKLNKVAIVESQSVAAQLYGKALYTSFQLIYPTLTVKAFKRLEDAKQWLTAHSESTKQVKKEKQPETTKQRKKAIPVAEDTAPLYTEETYTDEPIDENNLEAVNNEIKSIGTDNNQENEAKRSRFFDRLVNTIFKN